MIDPAGRTTAWEYDAYGSLLVQTLPDVSAVRTEFDLDHRPVCMTLIGGRQWGYEWDTFGNLLAQSDPSGAISRYTYDEYGQLVEHTGPRGASTRFDYHPDGNLAAQIDALGHRTQYRYDARGYLVEAIDALGQQTQYEYDRNGHLTRAIEPGGREIHCAYDADGNLSRHRDPMGHVTQMEYSALGQVSRRLAPDGTTVEYRYDTEEQLIGVVNERSELYALERDALGRIVVEADYWGQARRYRYGAAGELLCSTDPLGQTVEYRYDWLGRIVQKRVPHPEQGEALQIDSFAYDRHGDLVLAENPSCRVEFGYDAAGRMIEERQGDDFTIASDYDEAGNRIERRTRLIAGGAVVAHTVRYTYDALDAVTSIQIDDTAPVVLERDALGQICTEQLGAELRRELSYESGGQLASQRTLLTGTGELFASERPYDANGELVEKRDSRGGIERFQDDPVGRVIAHLDPAGQLRRYLYDPAGDLLKTHIRERRTADTAAAAKAGTWVREGEYEGCYYAYDRVGTRECLAIEVDTSLPGLRVQQVLARLKEMRGLPASITVDNGPEFAGKVLDAWAYEAGVTLSFIRPGKPVENAYIESFNGRFRDECLNEHWFVSMRHAKQLIEEWRIEYNTERPHSSLGYLTPAQFARAHDAKQQFLTSDSNCSSD